MLTRERRSQRAAGGYIADSFAIARKVIERFQASGDVISAVVLAEGACYAVEDLPPKCAPDLRWFLGRVDTLEGVLEREERAVVRPSVPACTGLPAAGASMCTRDANMRAASEGCLNACKRRVVIWRVQRVGVQVKRLRKKFHAFDDLGALFNDPLHGDEWVEAWVADKDLPSLADVV